MREEFSVVVRDDNGGVRLNPPEFSEWLLSKPVEAGGYPGRQKGAEVLKVMEGAFDSRLEAVSNKHLHPENRQLIGGVWSSSES